MPEFLLDTNVWVTISFVLFLVFAIKAGKDKVLALLDDRIADIKKEIETAENLRVEAQELLALYQRKQRDAAKDAEEIVSNAKTHAEEIKKQAEKDLEALMARREEQLKERLERMEENAIREIRNYAADLALQATYEIVAEKMTAKTNEKLIDDSIKNIKENIH